MSDLKNPFAKRDGRIIYISDLTQEEYGRRCNCTCAFCNSDMLARIRTKKRRPHFAHDGHGCTDEKAMLAALLQMLAQHLEDAREIVIPGIYIGYTPTIYKTTREEVEKTCPYYNDPNEVQEQCTHPEVKAMKVGVDEVYYHKENEAVSFVSHGREVGVVVEFRRGNCDHTSMHSVPKKTMYDALMNIDLGDVLEFVEASGFDAMRHLFLYELNNRSWVQNPRLETAYDKVHAILVKERSKRLAEKAERDNRERERREKERDRLLAEAKERANRELERLAHRASEYLHQEKPWSAEFEEQYAIEAKKAETTFQNLRQGYIQKGSELARRVGPGMHSDDSEHEFAKIEMTETFHVDSNEKQFDQYGVRWFVCERCGELRDEEEMKDYGGPGRLNRGVCNNC